MDLSLLRLKKPGARGTHPSTNELRDALRDNQDRLEAILLGLGDPLREGVVSGGVTTRLDASTIRISAGWGWVFGDGVDRGNGALSWIYRVDWPQTDVTVPAAAGSNFRSHRITIPVPAGGHGTSAPVVRSGTDDASVSLDTMDSNGTTTNGIPAIAPGEMQVAVAISSSTGVSSTGFRDRRRFAKGLDRYKKLAVSDSPTGQTTGSGGGASLLNGAFDFRAECDGLNVVNVGIDAFINVGSGAWYIVQLLDNGTVVKEWNAIPAGAMALHVPLVPTAGSHKFTWWHAVGGTFNTSGLNIYTNSPAFCYAQERITGRLDNGTT